MTSNEPSYTCCTRGDLTIRADFSQASAPIEYLGGDDDWYSSPFQVADARHRPERATMPGVPGPCRRGVATGGR